LNEKGQNSKSGGARMFYYLSYTKITILIQIVRLKIIYMSGNDWGFSGIARYLM
jgi:hypothetical protein